MRPVARNRYEASHVADVRLQIGMHKPKVRGFDRSRVEIWVARDDLGNLPGILPVEASRHATLIGESYNPSHIRASGNQILMPYVGTSLEHVEPQSLDSNCGLLAQNIGGLLEHRIGVSVFDHVGDRDVITVLV